MRVMAWLKAVAGLALLINATQLMAMPVQSAVAPVDLVAVLPPPPATGSVQEANDMAQVISVQQQRTAAQMAVAEYDAEHKSVSNFDQALGGSIQTRSLPSVEKFFAQVMALDKAEVQGVKLYWRRPRPAVVSAAVHPLKQEAPDDWSYPSGHATYAYSMAALLAAMVPERRAEIFARAQGYGESRIIMGAHFPSDVEGGKLAGTVIAAYVLNDPQRHADFLAARDALRSALHLQPIP